MKRIDRRNFIIASAALTAGPALARNLDDVPIIETTSHLWDPSRPQSTPFMPQSKGMSAAELRAKAPKGVVGSLAVESSPWIEDNLWLLEAARKDPFMVGVIGNLRPEDPEFPQYLERYHKDPMYLGIRHGNVWPGYDLPERLGDPRFVDGLRLLAQAGLVLDLANPGLKLLQSAVRVNDAVPDLTIIVNHLGAFYWEPADQPAVSRLFREYAQRPRIYGKVSALGGGPKTAPPVSLPAYKDKLDMCFESFGPDRVMGGGYFGPALGVFQSYLTDKPRALAESFFWRNASRAYRWIPRLPEQPRAV